MKQLFYLSLLLFFSINGFCQAQKYVGIWEGDLDAGVQTLRLVFNISNKEDGSLLLKMQSPQQSAMQLPADTVYTTESNSIFMQMKKIGISFSGKLLNDSVLVGEFFQGKPFPLQLKKVEKASAIVKPKRPQTPKPPFNYISRDVNFTNKDKSIQYAGTLTIPDTVAASKFAAVILISGSGPQDRDETILGHKPFAVIANHLTNNGIAVLRIDDRGVGKTTGNHSSATSADFADDKEAALNYLQTLKWIDKKRIGLIGHSEGGMIAPLLASKRKDIKAIVLLAGPGVSGLNLLTEQNVAILKSGGMSAGVAEAYGTMFKKLNQSVLQSKDTTIALQQAIKVLNKWDVADSVKDIFKVATANEKEVFAATMVSQLYNNWFRYFLNYNPAPALKKLSCNVLALNGSKDVQVLPASNLAGIKAALKKSKSKNYEIKEVVGLNHLFQTCSTCTIDEYEKLEESFSPQVLDMMANWLKKYL
ncbi:MAG TPA: alpha/beta fold hydrolase [Ferruginibacter sp.]|nr:alpha/beta fold hydrolase [Ferruginibacter sp.]